MNIYGIEFPEDLHPETEALLEKILGDFEEKEIPRGCDVASWRLLASNLDLYHQSLEALKRDGFIEISDRGNVSLSPNFTVNIKVQSLIQGFLREMGLTLMSRTRINKKSAAEEEERKDNESLLVKLRRGERV